MAPRLAAKAPWRAPYFAATALVRSGRAVNGRGQALQKAVNAASPCCRKAPHGENHHVPLGGVLCGSIVQRTLALGAKRDAASVQEPKPQPAAPPRDARGRPSRCTQRASRRKRSPQPRRDPRGAALPPARAHWLKAEAPPRPRREPRCAAFPPLRAHWLTAEAPRRELHPVAFPRLRAHGLTPEAPRLLLVNTLALARRWQRAQWPGHRCRSSLTSAASPRASSPIAPRQDSGHHRASVQQEASLHGRRG
mmetsp:Transcript_92949/g.262475  ORF Transcript_92949/g.262475 Transcript_92949/m.262475 type:complete len:251 (+) Transcript_92949:356-1108(+)